jgi:hypothetical protein
MVGHDAVGKKCNVAARHRLLEEPKKGGVVRRTLEKNGAFGCPVEDMEHQTRGSFSCSSRHDAAVEAMRVPDRLRASVLQK